MADLTRPELCVALRTSESTIRRLEQQGLPFTPVGKSKRYDLAEVKAWLRNNQCPPGSTSRAGDTSASWSGAREFIASLPKARLRVMPSA
jgi:hypothetical protein